MQEVGAAQRQDAGCPGGASLAGTPNPHPRVGAAGLFSSHSLSSGDSERHGLSSEVGVQHVFPLLQGVRVSLTLHSGARLQALPHTDTQTGPQCQMHTKPCAHSA